LLSCPFHCKTLITVISPGFAPFGIVNDDTWPLGCRATSHPREGTQRDLCLQQSCCRSLAAASAATVVLRVIYRRCSKSFAGRGRSRRIHSRAGWLRSAASKMTEPPSVPTSQYFHRCCRSRRRKKHKPMPVRLSARTYGPNLFQHLPRLKPSNEDTSGEMISSSLKSSGLTT
jgi:hypothetical protein